MSRETVFVIGLGEVGRRLAEALDAAGRIVRGVTRTQGWDAALDPSDPAPRLVAVREESLQAVLDRFPATLRDRLVLVQNGFLEAVHGELGPIGRGLIYFTAKQSFFEVLCPSPFYGGPSANLAPAIADGGIPTEVLDDRERFLEEMIIKGIWNVVVGLPLAVHDVDLETYRAHHGDELRALAAESAAAGGAAYGTEIDAECVVRKILETTRTLGWVRGGAKALPWRNGAVARFGRIHGVPTPVNDRLLRATGYDPDAPPPL